MLSVCGSPLRQNTLDGRLHFASSSLFYTSISIGIGLCARDTSLVTVDQLDDACFAAESFVDRVPCGKKGPSLGLVERKVNCPTTVNKRATRSNGRRRVCGEALSSVRFVVRC